LADQISYPFAMTQCYLKAGDVKIDNTPNTYKFQLEVMDYLSGLRFLPQCLLRNMLCIRMLQWHEEVRVQSIAKSASTPVTDFLQWGPTANALAQILYW